MGKKALIALAFAAVFIFVSSAWAVVVPSDSRDCVDCHIKNNFGKAAYEQWEVSAHAKNGVGCYDCHMAEDGDKDLMNHYGRKISVIVSPLDCARCHDEEVESFTNSHHANAGKILGSLDNVLGEVVEGPPAAVSGCKQCHGSVVKVNKDGTLSADTWPNTGIGRINPDGSKGSCTACHSRHTFSVAMARRPENCGKCHLGPDHPQKEIYDESKHGIAFYSNQDKMNLNSASWVVGKDYSAAPTCATCHVSAAPGVNVTHDPGERISWNLRPKVSKHQKNWESKRATMQKVCASCHNPDFVNSFYKQYDSVVELYNEKFGKPALAIMNDLRKANKLTPTPFDEKIEWTYFYLWHHEGRRARHGAAMMGPDYVQWHGFIEVAERFYMDLVPEAEELLPGVTKKYLKDDDHKWFTKGISKKEREKINKFYEERYGK